MPNHGKPLLMVLAGRRRDPPPVWLMRQAGRYLPEYRAVRARVPDFLALCYTPELAVEVTLQPLRRFPLDAAILFSDILVVPHALGLDVRFVEGEGPRVRRLGPEDSLPVFDPDAFDRHLQPVYETVARLSEALRRRREALIGFAGAPWTLAAYLLEGGGSRDFARARELAWARPAFVEALVDRLTEAVTHFLVRQIEHGAEVVKLFDSWAGVLPEPLVRRLVLAPLGRIVEALCARRPEVPVILFPRGLGLLYPEALQLGAAAVALDTTVPPATMAAAAATAPTRTLQGNLDPALLVAGGAALAAEVRRIVRALDDLPHVFNLGHGILPHTPPEHVAHMLEVLRTAGGTADGA